MPMKLPMTHDQPTLYEPLRLDQFLKLSGIAGTGGHAKVLIQGGEVHVNGDLEIRRRRKLVAGDVIQFEGQSYPVDDFISGG